MSTNILVRRLIKIGGGTIGRFTFSNLCANVARLLSGLVIAKFVTPTALGLFNSIGIYVGYLPVFNLGIMNGLNRDLPYFMGSGHKQKAYEIVSVAYYWSFVLAAISFVLFNVLSILHYVSGAWELALSWNSYSIACVSLFLGAQYLTVLYRGGNDFQSLARINFLKSFVILGSVFLVYQFEFLGLSLRLAIINIVELYLLFRYRPIDLRPNWNFSVFRDILKTGFPIYMVGQAFALWPVLQNTLVFKMGGSTQFGLFTIFIIASGSIGILNKSVSQIIYPRLSFAYGESNNLAALIKICKRPIALTLLVSIPAFAAVYFLLPYFVEYFLPMYVDGIDAALWVIPIALLQTVGVFNNIFTVIKKLDLYFYSLLVGVSIYFFMIWIWSGEGAFDLTIFPKAMMVGLTALYSINILQLRLLLNKEKVYGSK